ncbi:CDP-archaeol synthase [Thiohalocapsa sp.]|jgi:CDP-2,3-bis-(O-geranylgeranyl)-sn-glycerol synthase|uniref:CDP-archaeol synthase n=1 Tax=Thiohalocapsa sp. TaxID=2497641 RepID=UPI0025D0DF5E|nr:CDP-archaeol synthase [Thiohalocapsa sp.]
MWPLFLLIIAANGTPVLLQTLLGGRWSTPVDLGLRLRDGHRLLGDAKTWRGLAGAIAAGTLLAPLLGLSPMLGAAAAALAMAGDLLASFVKRRLGRTRSSRALLLDTVPESLFPGLGLMLPLQLTALEVLVLVILFTLLDNLASPVLYRLRLRRRPW